MARMPGAVWQGEHGSRLMSRWDIVCVHTIVGYAPAHAAHFSTKADGTILQSRDTRFQSAANLEGNYRVIAIENEDHGPAFPAWSGSNVPSLTPAQVSANARILRWAHETHGVPLQLCPNSRSTSRGLAYHRQGIDGNFTTYPGRVPGGELWTKHYGKVCPGDRRIDQIPAILAAATDNEGAFMAALSDAQQKELYDRVRGISVATVPVYQAESPLGQTDDYQIQTLIAQAVDVAAGVDDAFSTSGSPTRQNIAGTEGLTSLIELGLQRSPSFQALVAKIDKMAGALNQDPPQG